jgi:hypothetical protein
VRARVRSLERGRALLPAECELVQGDVADAASVTAALDELEWGRWLESDARGYGFVARVVGEIVNRDLVTPGQRRRLRPARLDA